MRMGPGDHLKGILYLLSRPYRLLKMYLGLELMNGLVKPEEVIWKLIGLSTD
jgi:hypothetical protein